MKLEDRFWEIDFSRGLAIILVVVFHFFFILKYLGLYALWGGPLFWRLLPRILGSTFITLVGLSLVLSYTRAKKKGKNNLGAKYLKRGLKIFSLGIVASLASWLFVGDKFIVFGILHLIGLSIILAYPLLHYEVAPKLILELSLASFLTGILMRTFYIDSSWLLWFGVLQTSFKSLDYYPLLPWFGFILLGIWLGQTLYQDYERKFTVSVSFRFLGKSYPQKSIYWLGKHTLKIYVLHVPIILIALYLISNLVWLVTPS